MASVYQDLSLCGQPGAEADGEAKELVVDGVWLSVLLLLTDMIADEVASGLTLSEIVVESALDDELPDKAVDGTMDTDEPPDTGLETSLPRILPGCPVEIPSVCGLS